MSYSKRPRESLTDAPVVNPYEQFTQNEFDDFVGGLTSKIRDALHPRGRFRDSGRYSDLSLRSGLGEFSFGRSVSVDTRNSSMATSVPPSVVDKDSPSKSERRDDQDDSNDEEEQEQEYVPRPAPPVPFVTGQGDEESPFVISDEDDDEGAGPSGVATPRNEASQLSYSQEVDHEHSSVWDEDDEPSIEAIEGGEGYDPRDNDEIIDDEEDENREGNGEEYDEEEEDQPEGADRSSPAWERVDNEEDDESQEQRNGSHHLDEFFTANMDHISSAYEGDDLGKPEMREAGHDPLNNLFAQDRHVTMPLFGGTSSMQEPTWPHSNQYAGSQPHFQTFFDSHAQSSDHVHALPPFGVLDGSHFQPGNTNMPSGSVFQSIDDLLGSGQQVQSERVQYGEVNNVNNGAFLVQDNTPSWQHSDFGPFGPPQPGPPLPIMEEPTLNLQDPAQTMTPTYTPPLSPSGRTLTAPDPSLISDNSSIATSVPIVHESSLQSVEPSGTTDLADSGITQTQAQEDVDPDRTLPAEVAQELNRDVASLPDPHRVPEPTDFGIPEGVAGLATRETNNDPSVWAEPPTPFRSEGADEVTSRGEEEEEENVGEEPEQIQRSESPDLPRLDEIINNISQPMPSPSHTRMVHWQDGGDSQPTETPMEELSNLEHNLLLPTPSDEISQTPIDEPEAFRIAPTQETLHDEEEMSRLSTPTDPGETQVEETQGAMGDRESEGSDHLGESLTRDTSRTDVTLSQNPFGASSGHLDRSITLSGDAITNVPALNRHDSTFAETQQTIEDDPVPDNRLASSDSRHDDNAVRSSSPFDGDSHLSAAESDQLASPERKGVKRRRGPPRLPSHVGTRELKALQEAAIQLDSPRTRRKISSQEVAIKGAKKRKGKAKVEPIPRPPLSTTSRSSRRGLRSTSRDPSVISKQESPVPSAGKAASESDGDKDELDILAEEDEHDTDAESTSPHKGSHPKKKRKRVARASIAGDDEDYVPEEQERSLKKRKLEAKETDLDHSLDTVELGSALEAAEGNVSVIPNPKSNDAPEDSSSKPAAKEKKKTKSKKRKQSVELLDATVDIESSESDSGDEGSDFRPSPSPAAVDEAVEGEVAEEVELTAADDDDPLRRPALTSMSSSKLSRKLNPDSRGYIPPDESDSDSDDEVVDIDEIRKDAETIKDTIPESDPTSEKPAADTAVADAEGKKKQKRKRAAGGAPSSSAGRSSGKANSTRTESVQGMDIDQPDSLATLQADSTLKSSQIFEPPPPPLPAATSSSVNGIKSTPTPTIIEPPAEESRPKAGGWGFLSFSKLWGSAAGGQSQDQSRGSSVDRMDVD